SRLVVARTRAAHFVAAEGAGKTAWASRPPRQGHEILQFTALDVLGAMVVLVSGLELMVAALMQIVGGVHLNEVTRLRVVAGAAVVRHALVGRIVLLARRHARHADVARAVEDVPDDV